MSEIRLGTAACVLQFQSLSSGLQAGDDAAREHINPEALEDEHGRFRVWSGNLGALQKGHSSLDYRLRDSPLLQTNILKLLEELRTNLSEALAVVSGSRLPYEKLAKYESEDEDDDWSQNEEDSDDGDDGSTPKSELAQRFLDIVDIIDNLYKLSVRIRSPTLRSRSLKAASFRPTDPDTGIDTFEQYALFDEKHTRELLTNFRQSTSDAADPADEYLVERLSKAITLRRRQFKYWRRHRDKLGASSTFADAMLVPAPVTPDFLSPQTTPEDSQAKPETVQNTPLTQSKWAPKSMLSGTEATQHHRSLDEIVDSQSVTSYATTTRDLTGHGIELPPPPKQAIEDRDFECPYCYIICPARYGRGRAWRTHLLQDLQPYVCTYEDCPIGDQLFRSRREWIEHEAGHRKLWRCPEHKNSIYKSSSGLEEHLHAEHPGSFPDDQIKSILRVGETSSIDLRPKCPLCRADATMEGGLQNHIANHLERFAAFALPKDVDTAEDHSDGGSGVASRGRSEAYSASQDLSVDSEDEEPVDWGFFEANNRSDDLSSKIERLAGKVGSLDAQSPERQPGTALFSDLLHRLPDTRGQRMDVFLSSGGLDSDEPPLRAEKTTPDPDVSNLDTAAKTLTARLHFADLPQSSSDLQAGLLQQFFESRPGYRSMSGLKFTEDKCSGHARFTDIMSATNALEAIDESKFPGVVFSVEENIGPTTRFAEFATLISELPDQVDDNSDSLFSVKPQRRNQVEHGSASGPPVRNLKGITTLSDIPTLQQLYTGKHLPRHSLQGNRNEMLNNTISLVFKDITTLQVDAIVNAVGRNMAKVGSDLSRLVHKIAGPELQKEVDSIKRLRSTGEVVMTDAYNLPCKKIIHAVRPHYAFTMGKVSNGLLAECYRRALETAEQNQLRTIAFPTLSAGGFGFPPSRAATVAIRTVREYLDSGKGVLFDRIIFCVFTERDWQTYWDNLPIFFPSTSESSITPLAEPSGISGSENTIASTGPISTSNIKPYLEHRYSAYVWELKELHEQIEGIAEDLVVFRDRVPDFQETIIRELVFIASTLAELEKLFEGSSTIHSMTEQRAADLDLICCVLRNVAGGVHEIVMQTTYTRNVGTPTHKDIWESYIFHLMNAQGLTFVELTELCGNFLQSLSDILKLNGREPNDMGLLRDKLSRYRLNQSGGVVQHVPTKVFDEALLARGFSAEAWESKGHQTNLLRASDIPSLSRLYQLGELEENVSTSVTPSGHANSTVCFIKHDITRLHVDAIVNSTDMAFSGLGTLDRAIFKAGGLTMQEDCSKFGMLREGGVRHTQGYLLPCRHVIHTVPPEFFNDKSMPLLRQCYQNALKMAVDIGARTIAFPALGAGELRYPSESAEVGMAEVRKFLDENRITRIEKIIFCVYGDYEQTTYKKLLPQFFPPIDHNANEALAMIGAENIVKQQLESIGSTPIQIPSRNREDSKSSIGIAAGKYERQRSVKFSQSPSAIPPRPLDPDEIEAIERFEAHAASCDQCQDPIHVYRTYGSLCGEGTRLAENVAELLFIESGGNVYNTALKHGHRVEVEFPEAYGVTKRLLRAINENIREPGRGSFVKTWYTPTPQSDSEDPQWKESPTKEDAPPEVWSKDRDSFQAVNYGSEPLATQYPFASDADTKEGPKKASDQSTARETQTRFSDLPHEQLGSAESHANSRGSFPTELIEGHYSYTDPAGMYRDTEPAWREAKQPTDLKPSDPDTKKSGSLAIPASGAQKSILRPPTSKFPEDTNVIREGAALRKGADPKGIPAGARWTKIDRRLVNPEALEQAKERFEERIDSVVVLRVLTKEEIQALATRTEQIRESRTDEWLEKRQEARRGSFDELSKPGKMQVTPAARWTKLDRKLVSPEALKEAGEEFEERIDSLIVQRALSTEEIDELANRTRRIRDARPAAFTIEAPSQRSSVQLPEEPSQPQTPTAPSRSSTSSPHGLPESYINQVKAEYADQPDVVERFQQVLRDFRSGRIDSPGALYWISSLFEGKPDLIRGFNIFLPPGYKTEEP
ncbi:uncharacterized protein BDZ99DRAFT_570424 [Mytilinidion resinicola]|uniref:Macro domain-containing protein n=1 Tax=Mytilinidion resinicola TaxID=574789 RepID=A0A6A6YQJ5_9PEZI|nr:uncharacterized protein BDZ99DRAFT_570424 [Mytilinidion resinicola]KAF2811172.1 hypothetical protein BDZ99DRAFT_570424 [Mytilinidion resinicola]